MSLFTPLPEAFRRKPAAIPDDLIMRLSIDQYHQMIQSDILTDEDHVELLEGWLVQKMTKKAPHILATDMLRDAFTRILPPTWIVRSQDPITLDDSEPEPDVCVCRGRRHDYHDRHPRPGEIALVAEVAETSLSRDRGLKKRLCARNGIAIYWIVNLLESQVEVYTSPTGQTESPDYGQRQDYGADQEVPFWIDGREAARLAVRDLLS